MKTMKRCLSFVLTLVMLAGLLPVVSVPVEAAEDGYAYKTWNQGDSKWGSISISSQNNPGSGYMMSKIGCAVIATNKLLIHAGQQSPKSFTPDKCIQALKDCGVLGNGGGMIWGNLNKLFLPKYAPQLQYEGSPSHTAWNRATAVEEISKRISNGYYVIVCVKRNAGTTHWMAVDSIKNNDIYVMDNGGLYGLYGDCNYNVYARDYGKGVTDQIYFKYSGGRPYPAYTPCSHSFGESGVCSKCKSEDTGTEQSGAKLGAYRYAGIVASIRKLPYSGAGSAGSVTIGAKVEVLALVKNANNENWYKVRYNGKTGYLPQSSLIFVSEPASEITFSQMWAAKNLVKGNSCPISGTITSKYELTSVVGKIVNASTKADVLVSSNVNPKQKSYSLKGSTVDNTLKFATLPAGSYQLVVTAKDSKGTSKSWTSGTFQVTAPNVQTCAKPTVTTTDVEGGKNVTVSTATSGATVTCTINGKTYTGTNAVSFKLTQSGSISIKVSKSGMQAFETTSSVTVYACAEPTLSAGRMTAKGMEITMAVANGDTGYYSVNGAAFQKYTGPFYLTASGIVQAYTKRNGCVNSGNVRQSYTLGVPAAPMPKLMGISSNIAAGGTVTLQWPAVDFATGYTVQVKKDGADYKTMETSATSAGFAAAEAGSYSATVTAKSIVGSSAASSAVTVTTHDPLTVTFKSDDGTVLTTQKVRYGSDAQAPDTVPAKRGYTFTGWDKSLANITADTVITAKFAINTYTVRFYDCNGTDSLGTQRLTFGQGISSEDMEAKVSLRTGYSFAGWHIQDAAADSNMDLEHIDSDMTLVATEYWADSAVQVVVSNLTAARNAECSGYDVSMTLNAAPGQVLGADIKNLKIIVALKSADGQMLASTLKTIGVREGWVGRQDVFVPYQENILADEVKVFIVGIDGNDRTGGALSKTVAVKPTASVSWSGWSTTKPAEGVTYQTRTEYRYKDSTRSTTTQTTTSSTAPAMSGWTLISTSSAYPSTWSAWSDSYIASSATREVQTQSVKTANAYTQYRYGRWQDKTGWGHYCPTLGKNYNGNTYSLVYTNWSTTQYTRSHTNFGACSNNSHNHVGRKSNNYWDRWVIGNLAYYWEESRTVAATYKTQYRYHDKNFTYTYEKWTDGAWSNWGETKYTASSAANSRRVVETRTMYRYATAGQQVDTTPSTAVTHTVTASLDRIDEDLTGKLATILVYKETNSDPTEPQLEFVGQTILEGNDLSVAIRAKEEPSEATGDFIVALALQGASNVVDVGKIKAPAKQFKVVFQDENGEEIETQTVEKGQSAEPPAAPAVPGKTFVCWNSDTTQVLRDMEVVAVYVPNSYSVAFVDFENESIDLNTGYRYGDLLLLPDSPSKEGMEFAGWQVTYNSTGETADIQVSAPVEAASLTEAEATLLSLEPQAELLAAGGFAVMDDLIVTAKWTPITYEVKFLDADGATLSSQSVAHGQSAQPPAYTNVPADMIFLGWNVEQEWWCVKSDMNVYPILVYKETAQAPVINGGNLVEGTSTTIELEAEAGADIYYTTDGSEPEPGDEGTLLYTGPIEATDSVEINAISVKPGKNNSETVYVAFWYSEAAEETEVTDLVDIGTYNVVAEPGKTITLQFEIENNPGLAGYMFYVDASPLVFSIPEDVETGETGVATGAVCTNGTLLTAPYVEGLGWQLLWFSATPTSGNGTLCTVTLETSEDAETGTYPITVRYSPANTFDGDFVTQNIPGVRVDFVGTTEFRMGDVNADGKVTNADVVLIARHIIGLSQITQERQFLGDVNNDSELTLADAIYLARYILGLEHSLL